MSYPFASFTPRLGITTILTVSMVTVILVLTSAITFLDVRRERAVFRDELERRGRLMASTLNDVMADPMYFTDIDELGEMARVVAGEADILHVQVFTPDGKILVDTQQEGRYPIGRISDEHEVAAVASGQRLVGRDGNTMEVVGPIQIGSDVIGGVRFVYDTGSVQAEIKALAIERAWQTGVLAMLGLVISYLLAQHFVRLHKSVRESEEALRKSEAEERSLAGETRVIAHIGQIIGSSLDMSEVYEPFAEQVRKLIPFDRMAVSLVDPELATVTSVYSTGIDISAWERVNPLAGTLTEPVAWTGSSQLIETEETDESSDRLPGVAAGFEAGLRSFLSVPLISNDQVIGVLHTQSVKAGAYSDRDVNLAERVANQIAGAIANSSLHAAIEDQARQTEVLAQIGRIISSSSRIDDVYERFAERVNVIVPFDRITVSTTDQANGTLEYLFLSGVDVPDRVPGHRMALAGTQTEQVVLKRSELLVVMEDDNEVAASFPGLLPAFHVGLRTSLATPLISEGEVIGVLHLQSTRPGAYSERDLRLVSRVADQIAGAVSNELLRTGLEREAGQRSVLAEIGRIISSSLDIDEVYERFADETRRLIPFDRCSMSVAESEAGTFTNVHQKGVAVAGGERGHILSLAGTVTQEVIRTRSGRITLAENRDQVLATFPSLLPAFEAGLRSSLAVPLISGNEVIGVLHFQSIEPNAYTSSELTLAQRVADQIAGAIASSQLHLRLEREAKEREVLAEIGRVIGSSLDITEVYERFVEQVRKLVSFDRITINLIDDEADEFRIAYTAGLHMTGAETGATMPLEGSPTARIVASQSGELLDLEELVKSGGGPPVIAMFKAGIRAVIRVPLVSRGGAIGTLGIGSTESDAYTEIDLGFARRVADQIAGAMANSHLLAERERLQEQLIQSQKMEAVGRLAGGVAHDFNNMLTAILGYTHLEMTEPSLGNRSNTNLQEIQKAAGRAANLTRQLLAFAQRQRLEPEVVNLNDLVADIEGMLRSLISDQIELATLLAPDLGLVTVDPSQIDQMIVNLVLNARDAIPNGGKITLETANVTVGSKHSELNPDAGSEELIMLTVSDTGIGMERETMQHVFEPFFTTKGVGEGTGLGLSICHGIASQSGGHFTVDSTPGHGTVFSVYLPRIEGGLTSGSSRDQPSPQALDGETVLLVDDDPGVRTFAARALQDLGYAVLEASNGSEALVIAQKRGGENIDLLFTDIVMPVMGGRELAEQFRTLYPTMPILFMSGYTEDALIVEAVSGQPVRFIPKPFTPDSLARMVREVLDNQPVASSEP